MGTDDDYSRPADAPGDADAAIDKAEAAQHKDMLQAWTKGAIKAANAATWLQAIGDQLNDFAASIDDMRPALPETDPVDWAETGWPETGVDADDIRHHLRAAMVGMYATAGGYRRAASDLERALRRQQADEASA